MWGLIVDLNNRHVTVEYRVDGTQLLADVVHYWRLPVVISHEPADGAVDVDPVAAIRVTLSRYLDPTTINADNLVLASGSSTPTLKVGHYCHVEMTATTIVMMPTATLHEAAAYTVRLTTGLKGTQEDKEGISLQREDDWTFRTYGTYDVHLPIVGKGNNAATRRPRQRRGEVTSPLRLVSVLSIPQLL